MSKNLDGKDQSQKPQQEETSKFPAMPQPEPVAMPQPEPVAMPQPAPVAKTEPAPVAKTEPAPVANVAPIDISELVKTIMQNLPASSGGGTDAAAIAEAIRLQNSNGTKHQSYGLTVDAMKEIKRKQMNGEVEMIPANKISKFKIPAHEKGLMHFSTERLQFDSATGQKTSVTRFHVMPAVEFTRMSRSVKLKGEKMNPENAFEGMQVIIYHDVREGVLSAGAKSSNPTTLELLEHMDEAGVRKVYFQTIGEEALPSDSKSIMIGLIKENIEKRDLVE